MYACMLQDYNPGISNSCHSTSMLVNVKNKLITQIISDGADDGMISRVINTKMIKDLLCIFSASMKKQQYTRYCQLMISFW